MHQQFFLIIPSFSFLIRFLSWRLDPLRRPETPPDCPPPHQTLYNMVGFRNNPIKYMSLTDTTGHFFFLFLVTSSYSTTQNMRFQYQEAGDTTWSHCFLQATNPKIQWEPEDGLDLPYESCIWSLHLQKLSNFLMSSGFEVSNRRTHHPNRQPIGAPWKLK